MSKSNHDLQRESLDYLMKKNPEVAITSEHEKEDPKIEKDKRMYHFMKNLVS